MPNSNDREKKLPSGWRCVRLQDICDIRHGSTPNKAIKEYWDGAIIWVSPKDMYQSIILSSQDRISAKAIQETNISLVPEGTILIVIRSGILAHSLPVAIAGRTLAFNQDIKAAIPRPTDLISDFLRWLLLFREPHIITQGVKYGATVHSIRSRFLEELPIALPPIAEQRRIAFILNDQMAAVDKARAAAQERLAAIKRLTYAYLRRIFPKSGQSIPSGWRWVKLRETIQEARAGFACGERDTKGIIQLRMNNIDPRGNFAWDEVIRVPIKGNIDSFILKPGDVLFNNTNSTELVGKSALFAGLKEPVVFSNHFTRLRTSNEYLSADFLSKWLIHQWRQGLFADLCNRWIGQSAVKTDSLLNLEIPLPPIAEQRRIMAILNDQMAAVDRTRAAAETKLEMINALPAALLRRAFQGEL